MSPAVPTVVYLLVAAWLAVLTVAASSRGDVGDQVEYAFWFCWWFGWACSTVTDREGVTT